MGNNYSKPENFKYLGAVTFVVLLFSLIYLPSVPGPFFSLDDFELTQIPQLRSLSWFAFMSLWIPGNHIDYYPFRDLTYILDIHLLGADPISFRVQNLFWALASYILFIRVLLDLRVSRWASLVAASLWLLAPLHAETFTWISARKDILAIFWFLFSLHNYLNYREHHLVKYAVLSLISFVLSLLSKSSFALVPLGLGVLSLTFWKSFFDFRERRLVLVLSLISLLSSIVQNWQYTKVNEMRAFIGVYERVASSAAAFSKMVVGFCYAGVNVLDVDNVFNWLEWNKDWIWPGLLLWCILLGFFIKIFLKKNLRHFWIPVLFIALYLPVSGLVFPHRNFYSVRYLEPLFLILVAGLALNREFIFNKLGSVVHRILVIVLAACFVTQTMEEVEIWSDPVLVRLKAYEQYPENISLISQAWIEIKEFANQKGKSLDPELVKYENALYEKLQTKCESMLSPYPCWSYYRYRQGLSLNQNDKALSAYWLSRLEESVSRKTPPSQVVKIIRTQHLLKFEDWDNESEPLNYLSHSIDQRKYFPTEYERIHHWLKVCLTGQKNKARDLIDYYRRYHLLEKETWVAYRHLYIQHRIQVKTQECGTI